MHDRYPSHRSRESLLKGLRPTAAIVALVVALGWWPGGQATGAEAPAEVALDRAFDALEGEQYDEAIRWFSDALRHDAKLSEAWAARGWVYAELGQLDKAEADYTQALRLNPADAETWCNRGHVRTKLGQLEAAIADLSQALRLDPELREAYHARAWAYSHAAQYEKAVADYSAALDRAGDDAYLRFDRAICLTALKRYAEALADLNVALRREPNDLRFYGARGAVRVYLGDCAGGAEDLKRAIAMNPRDAGRGYSAAARGGLSAEALAHGQKQVEQMLSDRPAMAGMGEKAEFLVEWAARKFAGEDSGMLTDWDPTPPRHSDAENIAPVAGQHARIRLARTYLWGPKQGQERPFEELWSNAVFELHNVVLTPHFERLRRQVENGQLSKEQYVEGIWTYEHRAAQQTRAFYVEVYLPWAAEQKLPSDPELWFAAYWEEAERTFQQFTDRGEYPWRPYARQYDWMTVRRWFGQGQYAEALRLLGAMAAEPVYPQDRPAIHMMRGQCLLELRRPNEAVEAATQAIALAPSYAAAYRVRAAAYEQLGEPAKAEADRVRAQQLER